MKTNSTTISSLIADGIISPNGNCTGLEEDTRVQFFECTTRSVGTGYRDYWYRVVGTEHAVVVHRNFGGPEHTFFHQANLVKDFFKERREYSHECRIAANWYGVPYSIALAIGPARLEEFSHLVRKVKVGEWEPPARVWACGPEEPLHEKEITHPGYLLTEELAHELLCGIYRRKVAICTLLPDMGEELWGHIKSMGQKNSRRVAEYLASFHPSIKRKYL